MSQPLISRSPDLERLQAEGYDIRVADGHLVIRDIPYLDASGQVVRGVLVKALTMAADITAPPSDHTMLLSGPHPHDTAGRPLSVVNSNQISEPLPGLTAHFLLSRKPPRTQGPFTNYYELAVSYIRLLSKHATAMDENVSARTYPVLVSDEGDDGPFLYVDTASARAGITSVNARVRSHNIAIVGLGGTGAYILDLIAKSPVREIHLYDGDILQQHNAFRYPGAVPISALAEKQTKVAYLAGQYAAMRTGVVPHPYYVDEAKVDELVTADFVFLAVDDNPSRALIAKRLELAELPFIDVGMGLYETDGSIGGQLRVTTSVPGYRSHLWDERHRLPTAVTPEDVYNQNVQIVDLNALNATLAVGRWKRYVGVFADLQGEHNSKYILSGNEIINEDR